MQTANLDKKISKVVNIVSKSQIYQHKLFIFLCITYTQVAYNALLTPIVFTNPLIKCNDKITTQLFYCSLNHPQQQNCKYTNNFTGTYAAGLYCDDRSIRMTLQSLFSLGSIVGLLTMPMISDIKGKKLVILLCLVSIFGGNIALVLGILYKIYVFIGLGMFFSALGSVSTVGISFSINSDFYSDDLRQKAMIYYCAVWGLTDMSVLLVYYVMPYWLYYLIFLMVIPTAVLLIYLPTFFIQSLHYLVHHKKDFNQSAQIIDKVASINKSSEQQIRQAKNVLKQIQGIVNSSFDVNENNNQKSVVQIIKLIVHNPKYLKSMLCLICIKMSYYSFYYGVQGSLQRTGFNLGISVFLLGLGQFTGYMTGSQFIPKMHRKKVLVLTNFITASIALLFITDMVQNSAFIASIILYACFTISSFNFSAITLIQTQSFPSKIRSSVIGMIFGVSFMIRMVIPFAIGYLNQRGIYPIIAASVCIFVLGIVPPMIIDQTYGYTNLQQPLINQTQLQLTKKQQDISNF